MKDYRVSFASLAWERVMDGVCQKTVTRGDKKLRLVEYTKTMLPHWCEKGHCGYILRGRFEVEFVDGIRVFEKGDGLLIPRGKNHKHRARALSKVVKAVFVEDAELNTAAAGLTARNRSDR
ncbi:MAG: cupin domain-containing protein [Verrucomicrobia bacterium]|nr:cupin domain-containing protein [Verrucomicrobiota bacterium]